MLHGADPECANAGNAEPFWPSAFACNDCDAMRETTRHLRLGRGLGSNTNSACAKSYGDDDSDDDDDDDDDHRFTLPSGPSWPQRTDHSHHHFASQAYLTLVVVPYFRERCLPLPQTA